MQQRRDEILAKKAKLAELKRQRELRKAESASRQSATGSPLGEVLSPTPRRSEDLDRRTDVNNLINSILGESRPGSTGPGSPAGAGRATRPTSVVSAGQLSSDEGSAAFSPSAGMIDREMQTLSIGPLATVYEIDGQVTNEVKKEKEIITYSKGVQASIDWSPSKDRRAPGSDSERDESPTRSPKRKRLSRRQKEREEEIRAQLRKEIEEELKAVQQAPQEGAPQQKSDENFPFKTLTNEELMAVENSEEFIGFVERSTKVLERALDQQLGYDILADYAHAGVDADDSDEGYGSSGAKKGRRIREVAQFWDERWSKKRMISDLGFSTKVHFLALFCENIADLFKSSLSSSWLRIPRTHLHPTIQMVLYKSGICTCMTGLNTSSMPSLISSLPSSLHSIPTSLWAARTQAKCCYGTPAPNLRLSRRRLLLGPATHIRSTP